MRHFRKLRRGATVLALAGLTVAGVIGFVHNFQPDPGWAGGLHHATTVVKIDHRMHADPSWGGGLAGS